MKAIFRVFDPCNMANSYRHGLKERLLIDLSAAIVAFNLPSMKDLLVLIGASTGPHSPRVLNPVEPRASSPRISSCARTHGPPNALSRRAPNLRATDRLLSGS